MSDNTDLTGVFHQNFLHFLRSLHQILDISNPHEYVQSVTKYSILQLPDEVRQEKQGEQGTTRGELHQTR